jgi:TRAP-type mannitol/chloroaromatic compound transport system substrate-binding protein
MRRIARLMTVIAAILAGASTVAANERIALVIGNAAYPNIPLANPVNDARLIATALRGQGFDVIETLDAGENEMKLAIKDFGNRLKAAQGAAIGLLYYAGHGVQVQGENYLIPVDAQIEDEGDVDIYAINANAILRTLEDARNGLNIVILDACRNNPFTRSFRAATRGLATMSAPTGTLIAYSTSPGSVALDGNGVNSPYTAALATAIGDPGVPIEKVFKNVRDVVLAETQGKQTPWEASSLTGPDLYLAGGATTTITPPADDRAFELAFWDAIKDSDRPADFDDYLARFPNGTFAGLAKRQRDELLGQTDVAAVPPADDPVVALPQILVEPLDASLVATRDANVRGGPSTDFYQIDRLVAGQDVAVTGKVIGEEWYRIRLQDGSDGYVWIPLLAEPAPQVASIVVPPPPQLGRYRGAPAAWRAQSLVPGDGSILGFGPALARFPEQLGALSNGAIDVTLHGPGEVVPTFEVPDAVRDGVLQAGWAVGLFLTQRSTAFGLLGGAPFGPDPASFVAWLKQGGGQGHIDDLFDHHVGAKALVCAMVGTAGDLWSTRPLRSLSDLMGLKVRAMGFAADTLSSLGVSPVMMPGSELIAALDRGVIDGANWVGPAADLAFGLPNYANHYYMSGILEPATPLLFLVNWNAWSALEPAGQDFVRAVCEENLHHSLAEYERLNAAALQTIRADGTTVTPFPNEIVLALRRSWNDLANGLSQESNEFHTLYNSMKPYSQ